MTEANRPVMAGVDGSQESLLAASWAAEDADRRRLPLHLVLVAPDPANDAEAKRTVHDLAHRCRMEAPRTTVTDEVARGHPAEVLIDRSARADLITVGSRGLGGFTGALLGSVSSAVAMHGACPVVVARRRPGVTGPLIVGLDGSALSDAALRFALDAAAVRRLEVVAMRLWQQPSQGDVLDMLDLSSARRAEIQNVVERQLAEQVADAASTHPEVRIRQVVDQAHPVHALARASRNAELVVVGHRGRGGVEGLLLGSVAAGVLHHAQSPVAVVRFPGAHD